MTSRYDTDSLAVTTVATLMGCKAGSGLVLIMNSLRPRWDALWAADQEVTYGDMVRDVCATIIAGEQFTDRAQRNRTEA